MNITILQENLIKALTKAGRIVPQHPQLPILQAIKIHAQKESIEFIASSLETTEKVWVGGKISEEGEVCISAKVLTELVASLPPGSVTIKTEKENATVTCDGFHATLPTMDVSEFPAVPSIEIKNGVQMDPEKFLFVAPGVLSSSATDEGRPILTGMRVESNEANEGIFVATDGYRLTVQSITGDYTKLSNIVIPSKVLSEIVRLATELKAGEDFVFVRPSETQFGAIVGDVTLVTRLIDGEYPNYRRIIPSTSTTRVRLPKEQFYRAVKSASIFARENANIIKISFSEGKAIVSANAPQVGGNIVDLDVVMEGDGGEIAFNSRFLLDFLSIVKEEEFLFEMTGSLNPGVFKRVNNEQYLHIIMPVRLN